MYVVGISAYYHDSAAAIIKDHRLVAAAQEERFTRKKKDAGFPVGALAYCLHEAGITLADVDYVAFYDKPLLTFNRLLETYLAMRPTAFRRSWRRFPSGSRKSFSEVHPAAGAEGPRSRHHFRQPVAVQLPPSLSRGERVLSIAVQRGGDTRDGRRWRVGDDLDRRRLRWRRQADQRDQVPHSIGMLYSAFTYYLGFKVNDGEYKVMGLAPYGEPRHVRQDLRQPARREAGRLLPAEHGVLQLLYRPDHDQRAFCRAVRRAASEVQRAAHQREMDLARSVQVVTEELVLKLARTARRETGMATYAWPAASRSIVWRTAVC